MKEKILSFFTASLITVIVLFTLTVISTRSFLSDSEMDKDGYDLPKLKLSLHSEGTNFLGKLLSFNKEFFPDFLVDYADYNIQKTVYVSKTVLDVCMSAFEDAVSAQ